MPSNKINSGSSKTSSCRFTTSKASSVKLTKPKVTIPRKVLPSKQVPSNPPSDRKTCSTGFIENNNKNPTKPKKTTKSDFSVQKQTYVPIDYCKNCGDALHPSVNLGQTTPKTGNAQRNSVNKNTTRSTNHGKLDEKLSKPIQQYYKNENYCPTTESTEDIVSCGMKKISLDTIKEVSEKHPSDSIFSIYPDDSEDDITYLDTDDQDSLRQLKEFRLRNYFECHSAKSRIRNKGSATSLQGHRCVYRFYLNDRLFPVPLSTDHNNQVRCVECHLPMELNVEDATKINGTIQAKVTIGKKNQDIMLLLPVKEPLIITEKRKEETQKDREVVFFGVINLDGYGNSIFNSTLPNDSLALKYQKGYKEFVNREEYNYRDFDKADVIII